MLDAIRNSIRILTATVVTAYVVVNLIDKQEDEEKISDGFQSEKFDDIW